MIIGDLIQHVAGIGDVYEVVRYRQRYDDLLAVTLDADPVVVRVINGQNWKVIGHIGS